MTGKQTPQLRRPGCRPAFLAVAAICLSAAFGFLSGTAFAAQVHIVRPLEDALVVAPNGHLRLKVKITSRKGGSPRPHAEVDGHSISAQLRRVEKGTWSASFPVGDLRRGAHDLTVTAGGETAGIDSRRFLVARRAPGAVDISWHAGWRKRGSRLLVVRTDVPITRYANFPKVFLNGKRVDRQLHFDEDARGFRGGFGPEAGLRFGRNKVRVEVLLRDGDYAGFSHIVNVGRGRPLAAAGPDLRTSVGEPIGLDGSASRLPAPLRLIPAQSPKKTGPKATASAQPASTTGFDALEPIEYQWKVISAPAGVPAELREPQSEEPIFVPEIPGTYVIQVLTKPEGGGPTAIDETTVQVPQSNSPMGVPIQTITASGTIQVGTETFPRKSSEVKSGVKMLVLSANGLVKTNGAEWGQGEQTFQPQSNGKWKSTSSEADLLTTLEKVGPGLVVVLTGQGRSLAGGPLSSAQSTELGKAIEQIGGTVKNGQTPEGTTVLVDGQWSIIGYNGLTEGHARQNFGMAQAALPAGYAAQFPPFPSGAGAPGTLNGFMQRIGSSTYQYVSPEFLALNTKWTKSPGEAPSPTQNTIAVGADHYTSASIPNGEIAMQLLVLDGSEPDKVLENSTYMIMNSGCGTATEAGGGIEALDRALHAWATEGGAEGAPGPSNIVIAQDFGRQTGTCWPGGNDPNWLQDALPKIGGNGSGWVGSSFPSKRSELLSMWNSANPGGFGSVAGNFGIFAGTAAHDAVANYRRPFYSSERKKSYNRDYGGLTLVASTNAYQLSSAFFQGQGENPAVAEAANQEIDTGVVTGVLRRNEQSQWEMKGSSGAAGASDGKTVQPFEQAGLYELMFQAPTAWPCSTEHPAPCEGTVAEIEAAQRYFVHRISPKSSVASLRDLYPSFFETKFPEDEVRGPYPPVREQEELGGGRFSQKLYETMQGGVPGTPWRGIAGEVRDVGQVAGGIEQWEGFFKGDQYNVDIQTVGEEVINEVNRVYDKLKKEDKEEEMNGAIAASALYLLEDMVELGVASSGNEEAIPLVAPSIGALASMIDVGDDTAEVYSIYGPKPGPEDSVPNNTQAIRGKVTALTGDVQARYAVIAETMGHFGSILVSDPEKLREAWANFAPGGPWDMSQETTDQLQRAMGFTVQRAAFETTLPMAFTQWVTSPRHTVTNPGGAAELPGALNYTCPDNNTGRGGDTRDPWSKSLSTTWALEGIGWTGGGPVAGTNLSTQNSAGYDIRGLKSNLSDMKPSSGHEPGLDHSGETASGSLMEKVFRQPPEGTQPSKLLGVGMSKEEVFGLEDFEMKKFGCGRPN